MRPPAAEKISRIIRRPVPLACIRGETITMPIVASASPKGHHIAEPITRPASSQATTPWPSSSTRRQSSGRCGQRTSTERPCTASMSASVMGRIVVRAIVAEFVIGALRAAGRSNRGAPRFVPERPWWRRSETAHVERLQLQVLVDAVGRPSRPSPDCLTPPKGAASIETVPVLSPTIPNSSASPTRQARRMSEVKK